MKPSDKVLESLDFKPRNPARVVFRFTSGRETIFEDVKLEAAAKIREQFHSGQSVIEVCGHFLRVINVEELEITEAADEGGKFEDRAGCVECVKWEELNRSSNGMLVARTRELEAAYRVIRELKAGVENV